MKTSWRILARRLEDVWPRRMYWSWPRHLEDVLKTKTDIFVLINTSSEDKDERRLQDVFNTSSSRRIFAWKVLSAFWHKFFILKFHCFMFLFYFINSKYSFFSRIICVSYQYFQKCLVFCQFPRKLSPTPLALVALIVPRALTNLHEQLLKSFLLSFS